MRDLRFDLGKEKTILSGLFRSRATGAASPIKATAFLVPALIFTLGWTARP